MQKEETHPLECIYPLNNKHFINLSVEYATLTCFKQKLYCKAIIAKQTKRKDVNLIYLKSVTQN